MPIPRFTWYNHSKCDLHPRSTTTRLVSICERERKSKYDLNYPPGLLLRVRGCSLRVSGADGVAADDGDGGAEHRRKRIWARAGAMGGDRCMGLMLFMLIFGEKAVGSFVITI